LFATADPIKYKHPAIVGGFGSGKTASIPLRWLYLIDWRARNQKVKCRMMIVEPTKEMVRDVLIPTLDEFFDRHGIQHTYHKTYFDYKITLMRNGKKYEFIAMLRSSDSPEALTGKNLTDIMIDEFDKKHSIEHQRDVWKECISRIRACDFGTCAIVTTPEGYKYTYELYSECEYKEKENFLLIKAKTYANKFLPLDYVDNLYKQYSKELVQQYIEGNFINLTQGKVYYAFDRDINCVTKEYDSNLPINLCVDFNVNPMKWILIQNYMGRDYVIDEIVNYNTTTMEMTKQVADKYGENKLYLIYGDYFGNARDTRSMTTDYDIIRSILKNTQLLVKVNPPVIDRINAVNSRLCNSKGERHLYIDIRNCPHLIKDFEEVVWDEKKREIDKKNNPDLTHASDALGYYIEYNYGLKGKPIIKQW
jgi:hypothetical protein